MAQAPRISDAEWEVMQVVWDREPVTAADVIADLEPQTGWNHRTVRTLLNRLLNKGVLAYNKHGKAYLYRSKVKRESCVRAESRSFVRRVFQGDAASLLAHFVAEVNLQPEDIAELRRLLDEKTKGQ